MRTLRETLATWLHTLKTLEVLNSWKNTLVTGQSLPQKPGWCNLGTLLGGLTAAMILLAAALMGGCALTQTGNPSPGNQPQAALSPSSLDFGDQDIGTTSNSLSVTVANTGGSDLVISGVLPAPSQFAVAGPSSTTIASGKQMVYTITFSPTAAQVYSGTLTFTINSATTVSVALSGKGRKRATISPASLSFANQAVNTTSAPQTVTVTNTGGANLVISSIAISPSQFALNGPGSTTISSGASVAYTVSFTPALAQVYSGSLSFTMNTAIAPVLLTGTGIPTAGPPQVSISPASLSFANQAVNTTSAPQTITVTNSGSSNLLIDSVTSSSPQFVLTGPGPTTVAPGARAVYNVTFTPTAAQAFSGSVIFSTNASPANSTVPESGTGIAGQAGTICGSLDDGLLHVPLNYTCGLGVCSINPFPPPARGSSFTDPQYGCTVTRLTDAVGDKLGAAAHHNYGTITPVNANDTLVSILLENGSKEIIDMAGGVVVPIANMPSTSSPQVPWDISIPSRFYYTTGATIQRADIIGLPACSSAHNCAVSSTRLHDFSGTYTTVQIPDQEDISDDGDHLWLVGGTSAFLYTISTDTVGPALSVGTKDSGAGWHKIQIMPSNRMLMTWSPNGAGPKAGQEIYNTDGTLHWHMFDNTIHTDCGQDLKGNEVCVVARIPDTGGGITGAGACPTWTGSQDGGIDVINMSTHQAQCLVDANWADTEISFRDGNAASGWVFITFFKSGNCNTYACFDTTNPSRLNPAWATQWVHFAEEGILVRIDNNNGSANKYRLFHTRSRSSEYYWAIPRGAISRDGKYVIFDSNFDISNTGLSSYTDVYLTKTQIP